MLRQRGREQGRPHPDDPPRRRHGTFATDRPPVAATIGRRSGRACMRIIGNSGRRTLEALVAAATTPGATVNTDERRAYDHLPELDRGHMTVNHGAGEWARDADGDVVREVHSNTMEGTWTGLRNFPRPFRAASKWHPAGDVAMFEWAHNLKRCTDDFLATMPGRPRPTVRGS